MIVMDGVLSLLPLFRRAFKTPCCTKLILRGQDLALGHINQKHVLLPFFLQFQNCLYIFYKSFGQGVRSNLLSRQFDPSTLYKQVLGNNYDSHQIYLFIIYFIIISYSLITNDKDLCEIRCLFQQKIHALAFVFI